LQSYPADRKLHFLGIDPTGTKFAKYYPDYIQLVPDFFSAAAVQKNAPGKKAKIITSIAMFYDLEEPCLFVKEIFDSLSDDGIWIFEQSYLPLMLSTNAYDTVCHEHLEYYALEQIKWMMDRAGFRIIDVALNDTNGGSFRVTVAKEKSAHPVSDSVMKIVEKEKKLGLDTLKPYEEFKQNINKHKEELSY
jgi:NDP-4-keto-2,6-dideoxyhexose 3-C-methyltransferase